MELGAILAVDDATRPLYVLTAFGAGVISFLSPCVLPIVPAYLSLITGVSVGDVREGNVKVLPRIAYDTALFVAGFTVVFVLLGLITTAAGEALFENQKTLTRISGALVILMALYLAGSQLLMTPRLYQEFRFHPHLERFGPVAAPVAGVAFGLGWTPCIGPVLGAILSLGFTSANVWAAGLLLFAYSVGLAVPFLVAALALPRIQPLLNALRRHHRAVQVVSGIFIMVVGVLILTNAFVRMAGLFTFFI
jgi:cytochrome c-type biogenesis protein